MIKIFVEHWHALCALTLRPLARILLVTLLVLPCAFQDYSWMIDGWSMIQRWGSFPVAHYGPAELPTQVYEKNFYDFGQVERGFHTSTPLRRIKELERQEFHQLLLKGAPPNIARKMKPHLPTILHFSEKHQLDPLWVLSVVWVESHFKVKATSPVQAAGLMQIMPRTGRYLNDLLGLKLPLAVSHQINYDPYRNVELGTFYLKMLHRRFFGRYDYATVAYNMGPTYTSRRLRRGRSVGTRNRYLTKVRRSYRALSVPLKNHLRSLKPAYKSTYVYDQRYQVSAVSTDQSLALSQGVN